MAALDESQRSDLRAQLIDAFEGADYPVSNPMGFVPALPDGPTTRFEVGEFAMTAMELQTKLPGGDFPYDDAESFVDDVMEKLDEEDFI
jgi:hypothetical protein